MRNVFFIGSTLSLLLTVGCGASDDTTTEETPPDGTGGMPGEGPEYAPGIADPCDDMNTVYANDEVCLKPPPEDMGYQVHYGPEEGTDYDDPDAIADFLIPPTNADIVQCQFRTIPIAEEKFVSEYHTRARMGTHHVILWTSFTEDITRQPDGSLAEACRGLPGHLFIPGTQSGLGEDGGRLDVPLDGLEAPENEGAARRIMPNPHVAIETHYINTTGQPMLAEVWVNMIYRPASEVKQMIDPIFLIGGINTSVSYGQQQIVGMDNVAPPTPADGQDFRIMGFAAHAHAHTQRVTAWINRAGGEKEIVYETYDWSEPLMAMFDTQHEYDTPTMEGGLEAAHTGILTMAPGDTFGWECHISNDDLDGVTLVFGDGAYNKEMCNIFGYWGPGTGSNTWVNGFGGAINRQP